jgi:hypothetical protein
MFFGAGYDMGRYWNIKPGNYWIFEDENKQMIQRLTVRWDVESKTKACSKDDLIGYPILMTKSNVFGYWGPPFNSAEANGYEAKTNVRLWFNDRAYHCPYGESPCLHFPYWKAYQRNLNQPYTDISNLWWDAGSGVENSNDSVGYYQAPLFLTNLSRTYSTRNTYFFMKKDGGRVIPDGDLCNNFDSYFSQRYQNIKEGISYTLDTVDNSIYQGPVIVFSQSEQGPETWSWTVKEDWYFAKDIGLVKHTQKKFRVANYPNNNSLCDDTDHNCTCNDILTGPTPGDDSDCNNHATIKNPMHVMNLKKYYLGTKLDIKANGQNTLSVKQGDTYDLSAVDPSTGYTYEGYLEYNSLFTGTNGTTKNETGKLNLWFNETGKVKISVGAYPPGTYSQKFRPWVRRQEDALASGSESIVETPDLPWSDPITIVVQSIPGDFNNDQKVNIIDLRRLLSSFTSIFDYNILVENFGSP